MINRRSAIQGGVAAAFLTGTGLRAHAQTPEFRLKWASANSANHPVNVLLGKAFDAIRADSGGRVDIQLFPDGQLGGQEDTQSQVRNGAIDFVTAAGSTLSPMSAPVGIINIPFAFSNHEAAWNALDGELGERLRNNIRQDIGLHVFDKSWDFGFRQMTTRSNPIHAPEDLRGLKMRSSTSPVILSMFEHLGAAPTVISFTELYTSLQTGVVDGQDNPLVAIDTFRMHEVQKFCALTHHTWDAFFFVAKGRNWSAIPPELQAIITKHVDGLAQQQRNESRDGDVALRAKLEEAGMQFNSVDDAAFRSKLIESQFYSEWKGTYSPELWAVLEEYAGKLG